MAIQEEITKIPLFSVVVPCYMQSEFLKDALNSVLDQSYLNWECIVINDGSKDKTEEVALEFCKIDKRFKFLNQTNGGLSSARNLGISNSLGSYILPLDADDKIGPDYLLRALEVFISKRETTLVYCKADLFGKQNGNWDLPAYSFRKLLTENMIFCSAIFRKSDFEICGGYDLSFKKGWEDWDLWIRLLKNGESVVRLEDTHFYYRKKELSMIEILNKDKEVQKEILNKIYFKNLELYSQNFPAPITAFQTICNLFDEIEKIKAKSNEQIERLYKSKSFRLGNAILSPFRAFIR